MKKSIKTSMSLTQELLGEVDKHPLTVDASRSAFIRKSMREKLERDKENQNQTEKEKGAK